jgi:DNA replication protein DnaC
VTERERDAGAGRPWWIDRASPEDLERSRARKGQVWPATIMDMPAEDRARGLAVADPDLFGMAGDAVVIRARCPECRVEVPLPCPGGVTPYLLRLASVVRCEPCAEKDRVSEAQHGGDADHKRRLAESGMPHGLRGLTWDDWLVSSDHRKAALDAAKAWATAEKPRGLLLWGTVGVGKTRLTAIAVAERLRRWPMSWVNAAVLMAQLQASFADEDRKRAIMAVAGTGGLVLDDIDKVATSVSVRSALFAALDQREKASAAVLVSTNLRPPEWKRELGEAVASRLSGLCQGRVFELDGPDRRISMDERGGS